jgi:hypothetical protein
MTFSESKSKELTEILNQLKSKIDGLQTERKMEIQSDIVIIENELSSQKQDKIRVENALGSLYNKIKDITLLLGIAIQIANWFKPAQYWPLELLSIVGKTVLIHHHHQSTLASNVSVPSRTYGKFLRQLVSGEG